MRGLRWGRAHFPERSSFACFESALCFCPFICIFARVFTTPCTQYTIVWDLRLLQPLQHCFNKQ